MGQWDEILEFIAWESTPTRLKKKWDDVVTVMGDFKNYIATPANGREMQSSAA